MSQYPVELRSQIQFYDGIKTADIHETLVKAAADLISGETPDYQYLARLAVFNLREKAYTIGLPTTVMITLKSVDLANMIAIFLKITHRKFEQMNNYCSST